VPGSGLGLAMVREIAGAHAGELKLTSRLGHGTTAELRLPAAATTA
jgi:signal transduction histidine kinase